MYDLYCKAVGMQRMHRCFLHELLKNGTAEVGPFLNIT